MIEYTAEKCFLGEALRVSNGVMEFVVPLKVGPRIIALNKTGCPNIFFNDIEEAITKDVSAVYGEGKKWHIYGGHRLWVAPEDDTTYYPDNEEIIIEKISDGVILSTAERKETALIPSIKVKFVGDNKLEVTHKFVNNSEPKELCLWGLTVMKAGGKMELYLEEKNTGYLANRNLVFWSYSDMKDERLEIYNNKLVMKSSEKIPKPLKVGIYKEEIKAVYTIGAQVFTKQYIGDNRGSYPDFHCNFECYVSDKIHEIESLSPIRKVDRGGSIEMTEMWTLE